MHRLRKMLLHTPISLLQCLIPVSSLLSIIFCASASACTHKHPVCTSRLQSGTAQLCSFPLSSVPLLPPLVLQRSLNMYVILASVLHCRLSPSATTQLLGSGEKSTYPVSAAESASRSLFSFNYSFSSPSSCCSCKSQQNISTRSKSNRKEEDTCQQRSMQLTSSIDSYCVLFCPNWLCGRCCTWLQHSVEKLVLL
jgi:hypothetical protein